jgi:hypothetical protein
LIGNGLVSEPLLRHPAHVVDGRTGPTAAAQ